MMVSVVSERSKDKPRIGRPRCLKGSEPFMKYKWGGVKTCKAYICGEDVWIKHNGWLSGDAWIKISGCLSYNKRAEVLRRLACECLASDNSRFCSDDERMFADVYLEAFSRTKKGLRA